MLPNLPDQIDLPQKRNEDGHSAEGSYRPFGLAQDHPLAGQQSGDFPPDRFVPSLGLHISVVSKLIGNVPFNFAIQAEWLNHPRLTIRGAAAEPWVARGCGRQSAIQTGVFRGFSALPA
jgi:hypothetical protein